VHALHEVPVALKNFVPARTDLHAADGTARFDVDSDHLDAVVRHLAELGVRSLVAHPPTLEELFLRHYGDELDDQTVEVAPR
jgi:ABC-2 type transport system ATP-binding protein